MPQLPVIYSVSFKGLMHQDWLTIANSIPEAVRNVTLHYAKVAGPISSNVLVKCTPIARRVTNVHPSTIKELKDMLANDLNPVVST